MRLQVLSWKWKEQSRLMLLIRKRRVARGVQASEILTFLGQVKVKLRGTHLLTEERLDVK